jgi:hypothetical protein
MFPLRSVALVAVAHFAAGFPQYVPLNPNGNRVPGVASIGHQSPAGGGPENLYGFDFHEAGTAWSLVLCTLDSDGDGLTNGFELGDPCCVWTAGGPPPVYVDDISLPGLATGPYSAPATRKCGDVGACSNGVDACVVPPQFFVATDGDDVAGDGSLLNPWATWAGAAAALRPQLSAMSANVTVYLRGGTFALNASTVLTPADSGRNGFFVRYVAFPGEVPLLSGGVQASGWGPLAGTAGVWSAPLPVTTARQFWVDDLRVTESVARGVNLTESNTELLPSGYLTNDAGLLALVKASPLAQAAADVEFIFTSAAAQWQESRARVASWQVVASSSSALACPCLNISMAQPGFTLIRSKGYKESLPTGLINFIASLSPGQGYVSPSSAALFYAPLPGQALDNVTVIVAALDGPLLALLGDRTAQPAPLAVSNVLVQGIAFSHSTWLSPTLDGGYAPDQGGIGYSPLDLPPPLAGHGTHPVPAAVQLSTAHNVTLLNVTVEHVGASGIAVEGGSQDVLISRSSIRDISCSGIRLGEVSDIDEADPARLNARLRVADNALFGLALEFRDCSGIFGGFVSSTTIEHNDVQNTSWAGLTVGWMGWGGAPVRASLGGNRIVGNRIEYVNLVTGDGGTIYVMAPQPSRPDCSAGELACYSEMAFNYVANAIHHAALLYHDEGSAFWFTHDNVVSQPQLSDPHGWWWSWAAAWASSEYNILIADNTARGVNRSDMYAGNNLTLVNSTLLSWGAAWPPAAQAVVDAAGVRP